MLEFDDNRHLAVASDRLSKAAKSGDREAIATAELHLEIVRRRRELTRLLREEYEVPDIPLGNAFELPNGAGRTGEHIIRPELSLEQIQSFTPRQRELYALLLARANNLLSYDMIGQEMKLDAHGVKTTAHRVRTVLDQQPNARWGSIEAIRAAGFILHLPDPSLPAPVTG